ncbi:hypothetical protein TELCIR_19790 [Teladorsagia circumcincta]|uniref:Uncharacterized protein n=1 Tax=Teladorsagia circumcincta TaxID=45464 RepID=A0A2G9TLE5_TELCI|nr:hypothetical protein TELCIR_19790 [Teladorsagia circumcincta]
MKDLLKSGQLGFGCLETWLLLKLTDGNVHIAEASNYSSSGMFDPFIISLGTGTFVDLNTGGTIHASMNGKDVHD